MYDSTRNRIVFLGYDPTPNTGSTYAYTATLAASYQQHGAGCAGTTGVPSLGPTVPWSLPWLGESLGGRIANLPLSAAILTMGFSDTVFGSYPLPLDVGPFGMPGCMLRSSPDASVLVVGTANTASFSIPVPNVNPLRGLAFFQQAAAIDPTVNAAGATLSNSVRGVVGTK